MPEGVDESAYVDVAPFAPVRGTFVYAVGGGSVAAEDLPGRRVVVPFGSRHVVGVVVQVHDGSASADIERILAIADVLDDTPVVSAQLLQLLRWAADYYFASLGELIRAALPVRLHGRARRWLRITADGKEALAAQKDVLQRADLAMSPEECDLLARISRSGGRAAAPRRKGKKGEQAAIAALLARGWLSYSETRDTAGAVAMDLQVRVCELPESEQLLNRAPRQRALYEQIRGAGETVLLGDLPNAPADAKALLKKLESKGLVAVATVQRPFFREVACEDQQHTLTAEQVAVLEVIADAARQRAYRGFVLHGVTGSGKTEVYLQAIAKVLEEGQTALVLVPEIALTPQLSARFRARFGQRVAVLHSGLGDADRYEQWQRIRTGQCPIVVGARSAVFAPLNNLGIVIVDEEHDGSFKQEEGVRYHGRDLALVRAHQCGAIAVLGSATPSFESFAGVDSGRLSLLQMPNRATARPLPVVDIVDLRVHRADSKTMISAPLMQGIAANLEAGRQTILFLNRRGFSTFVICKGCGYVFRCENCSVSLTHHRRTNRLLCHYCGYSTQVPKSCPQCNAEEVSWLGHGTEKLETSMAERFPGARLARLDRDTAGRGGLENILRRFAQQEIDILVGTQIVTKGHDFPGVTLVGVICADLGLQFPDFRAAERTFQLLTQVAGRAGRGDDAGRVIIQTYSPDHPAVRFAQTHAFERFFAHELGCRQEVGYPPARYLTALHFDGANAEQVVAAAKRIGKAARTMAHASVSVLGPAEAPIQRLRGRTRWMVLLKCKRRDPMRVVVAKLLSDFQRQSIPGVRLSVDVDPLSML